MAVIILGFVTDISRSESISGGKPQRWVKISGHDYGKLLQIIQIVYLPGSITDNYFLDAFKWFQLYADTDNVKEKSAEAFINEALDCIINLFIEKLTVINEPRKKATAINTMKADVTIDGNVSPFTPNSFQDVSCIKCSILSWMHPRLMSSTHRTVNRALRW